MSKKNKLLTIAIPTYNRFNTIIKCLENIDKNQIFEKVDILISDNNSEDNTFDKLKKKYNNKFYIYKNNSNIGFANNTIKLFELCTTKYLLWISDEEDLNFKNLDRLIDTLEKNDLIFLCTQYFKNNNLFRGKSKISIIKENEIWESASHLPGIIFNKYLCNDLIKNISELSKSYVILFKYYPQIFFLIHLMAIDNKKCMYLNFDICYEKNFVEETHDLDLLGNHYSGVSVRWQLHKELVAYLKFLIKNNDNVVLKKILTHQKKRILKTLRLAIEQENNELKKDFDASLYRHFFSIFIRFFYKIILKPKSVFKAIYKLITN